MWYGVARMLQEHRSGCSECGHHLLGGPASSSGTSSSCVGADRPEEPEQMRW